MLRAVSAEDRMKLARGLTAALLAVVIGVTVVDMQMNDLTQQHEFVQLLNLKRDPREGYSAYFFGNSYPLGAVFPLASIENNSREFIIEAGNIKLRLPTKVSVDTTETIRWMQVWGQQFSEEAHKTKASLISLGLGVYRQTAGYLEQYRYLLQGESGK